MYIRGYIFSLSFIFIIVVSWFTFIFTYFYQKKWYEYWYWASSIIAIIGLCISFIVPSKNLLLEEDELYDEYNDNLVFKTRATVMIAFLIIISSIFFQFLLIEPLWNMVYLMGYINPIAHSIAFIIIIFNKMFKGGLVLELKKNKISDILYQKLKQNNVETSIDENDNSSEDIDSEVPELMFRNKTLYIRINVSLKTLVYCNAMKCEIIDNT